MLCGTILFKFWQTAWQRSSRILLCYIQKGGTLSKRLYIRGRFQARGGFVYQILQLSASTSYVEESGATSSRRESVELQGLRLTSVMLGVRIPLITCFVLFAPCLWHMASGVEKACNPWNTRATGKERPYPIRTTDKSLFRLGRVVQIGARGGSRIANYIHLCVK